MPPMLMETTGMYSIPAFFQCTADETDVVGCTAAAAGLGDNNRNLVQVIFTGKQGIHDLADNTQGG
mgnify:CR=1 FL=1